MKNISTLFEYHIFQPNAALQLKIDAVENRYMRDVHEITDDELDVSAAGDAAYGKPLRRKTDERLY